jgi:short-subunit dehydrogenase
VTTALATVAPAAGGKIAVVTGASSGIGRATALRFARGGYVVVAVARTRSALETLAAEGPAGSIVIEACDAADGADVAALAARVLARGVPSVIVNSAGLGSWKYLEDTTPAELATLMGAPFFAAAHVTAAFLGAMIERGSGAILHVGSPASFQPWPGATAYATSRFALRGLHEALCMDLIGTGVTSSHVIFGEVTSSYFENNPGSQEHIPRIARIIPKMTPEQCAAVLWSTAHRPQAEVFEPFLLRAFFWTQRLAPWFVRTLILKTGRVRERRVLPRQDRLEP